jgi:hypothetical protein
MELIPSQGMSLIHWFLRFCMEMRKGGGTGCGRGQGGEITQIMYTHGNKRIIKKLKKEQFLSQGLILLPCSKILTSR